MKTKVIGLFKLRDKDKNTIQLRNAKSYEDEAKGKSAATYLTSIVPNKDECPKGRCSAQITIKSGGKIVTNEKYFNVAPSSFKKIRGQLLK